MNVGSGGGAAAAPAAGGAGGAAAAGGDAADAPAEEEKKEEGMFDSTGATAKYQKDRSLTIRYREGRVRRGHGFRSVRLSAQSQPMRVGDLHHPTGVGSSWTEQGYGYHHSLSDIGQFAIKTSSKPHTILLNVCWVSLCRVRNSLQP